ncbi:helix-turn-helix transcriptional regulator [Proteus mirabilis]|uniref:helix-turn-helix transcriptional regulator n=1 Tax=Proteus mirabilis TaxID=584 RepID=UPI000EF990CE|nr:transcriptional regulator [Proteus mirabilis]
MAVSKIKVARVQLDLTQQQLAEKVGVTRQTISLIERGDYAPSIVLSLKIAQIFNVPVEEIFTLVEGEDDGEE